MKIETIFFKWEAFTVTDESGSSKSVENQVV